MIDLQEKDLSISTQCEILGIPRQTYYYVPRPAYTEEDIKILHKMDKIYTKWPFYGYRRQYLELIKEHFSIGKERVRKYMRILNLETFYPKKKTTITNKMHKVFPYLLRNLKINRPNQVWAADITYIRLEGGFCYLIVLIDWFSRYALSWELSNSLDIGFCQIALENALRRYPAPEIFNTDQGSQFTSQEFTKILIDAGIKISMDGKRRWIDNVIIERFFRSLKQENIYLYPYETVSDVRAGCDNYMKFYNIERPHSSLYNKKPKKIYLG